MQPADFYDAAHLFVAAVRVLTHQAGVPPSVESVAEMTKVSRERGHHLCRKLAEREIIQVIEGAFGTKLFVKNHTALEEIPRGETDNRMDEALKSFHDNKKKFSERIESFQSEQEEKKKKLFADLEKQLKQGKTERG